MALISIIVPVYNVEKYIHRSITSILNQTFSNFELILVDDGSPDNCGKICDEYAEKDKRIHVIHKRNGGLSDARNFGIDWVFAHSDSEWITFIDSDDWIHPDYLNFLYNAILETNTSISICSLKRIDSVLRFEKTSLIVSSVQTESFFCNKRVNSIVACGKLFKKTDFELIRFPVGKLHEDEFTTYKILFKYEKVAFVDNYIYFYYVNPESITQSGWNLRRLDNLEAFQKQISFFKENGFKKAYKRSIRALFSNIGIAIENLRKYYPEKRGLRFKVFLLYSFKKLRLWGRFLTEEERITINRQIFPRRSKLFNDKHIFPKINRLTRFINKKIQNLKEVLYNLSC